MALGMSILLGCAAAVPPSSAKGGADKPEVAAPHQLPVPIPQVTEGTASDGDRAYSEEWRTLIELIATEASDRAYRAATSFPDRRGVPEEAVKRLLRSAKVPDRIGKRCLRALIWNPETRTREDVLRLCAMHVEEENHAAEVAVMGLHGAGRRAKAFAPLLVYSARRRSDWFAVSRFLAAADVAEPSENLAEQALAHIASTRNPLVERLAALALLARVSSRESIEELGLARLSELSISGLREPLQVLTLCAREGAPWAAPLPSLRAALEPVRWERSAAVRATLLEVFAIAGVPGHQGARLIAHSLNGSDAIQAELAAQSMLRASYGEGVILADADWEALEIAAHRWEGTPRLRALLDLVLVRRGRKPRLDAIDGAASLAERGDMFSVYHALELLDRAAHLDERAMRLLTIAIDATSPVADRSVVQQIAQAVLGRMAREAPEALASSRWTWSPALCQIGAWVAGHSVPKAPDALIAVVLSQALGYGERGTQDALERMERSGVRWRDSLAEAIGSPNADVRRHVLRAAGLIPPADEVRWDLVQLGLADPNADLRLLSVDLCRATPRPPSIDSELARLQLDADLRIREQVANVLKK